MLQRPKTRPQNSTKSSFAREGLPSKFPTEVSGLMQKRQMSWQYAEVRCDNLRPASRTLLSNSPVLRIVSTCAFFFFFFSLAERAITAVPVTALQKEAIVTSSAMPRFHHAETKNKGRQHKKQPSKTNNTTPTKHKPKTKHLSGNRAAYSCTTYN